MYVAKLRKESLTLMTQENLDHNIHKRWAQAKAMGSKLLVGISDGEKTSDMVLNACSVDKIDAVIAGAPTKIALTFIAKYRIGLVVCRTRQSIDTNDAISRKKCLMISDDGRFAKALEYKDRSDH
uniref:Uncharacterized protein n=1 Tax=Eucampia antarctica TaxID=49252 RepID=A0A7S2WIP7_9STRA|mmetsp:Transcript_30667/g.29562  ORF Transcript_30667/g.29562 Transcript_30667/m.29562 type:complete len:125 (+) Transcript_30667:94-468(+)